MDHGSFDRLARLLGAAGTRRAALGALLGAGALGVSEAADARNKKKRRSGKKGKGRVSAQAVCQPPGHGLNRNNCDYTGDDFSGQDIASSNYRNTIFRDATLVETDLSSSSARGAIFTNANLCGADLSSSTLREANFDGANLSLADLSSSSCGGAVFTAATTFCGTIGCNGNVRNDDCPGGLPSNLCCTPCGPGEQCTDNECVCTFPACSERTQCSDIASCAIHRTPSGECVCVEGLSGACSEFAPCDANGQCPDDFVCTLSCCPGPGQCRPPCGAVASASSASRRSDSGGSAYKDR